MPLIANLGSRWSFCLVKLWVVHLLVCSLMTAWNHHPVLEPETLAESLILQQDFAVMCCQDTWHTWCCGVGFPWESAGPADSVAFVLCFVNVLLICSDPPASIPPEFLAAWTCRISSCFSCPNRTFELEEEHELLQMSSVEKKATSGIYLSDYSFSFPVLRVRFHYKTACDKE